MNSGASKMKSLNEISILLKKTSSLLRQFYRTEWAQKTDSMLAFYSTTPTMHFPRYYTFWGARSINDIVLYKHGKPLSDENDVFHTWLSKLYIKCSGKSEKMAEYYATFLLINLGKTCSLGLHRNRSTEKAITVNYVFTALKPCHYPRTRAI